MFVRKYPNILVISCEKRYHVCDHVPPGVGAGPVFREREEGGHPQHPDGQQDAAALLQLHRQIHRQVDTPTRITKPV